MQYFYLVSYRWTSFYIEYRSKLNYMWSLIVSRASYLASSRSVTHKTSTPCLLSWKVCLLSVMIYFFYGNGRLAHHPTRRTFSFQDHQGTKNLRLPSVPFTWFITSRSPLPCEKRSAWAGGCLYHVIKMCNNAWHLWRFLRHSNHFFFFCDVNMFCILI